MESIHIRNRGFTLIEMLVVLAIITILTGITITSQSSFDKTVVLSNTAYDVALSIRSAEGFGIGSRAAGSTYNAGYGVHFASSTPSSYILFADTYPSAGTSGNCHTTVGADPTGPGAIPGDCVYEPPPSPPSPSDVLVNTYTLGNGITISDFCAYSSSSSSWSCINSGSPRLLSLDISFARPNGDATITVNGVFTSPSPYAKACLFITSPQGGYRYVSVEVSGEISVSSNSCTS
ncbi:MAG: prepilin-type N-terminal cleavage/methylation domain-containing protein [Minisyncoccota bacterium]